MSINAAQAREQMVLQQIRTWDVFDDRVLSVMRSLPRELFVPASYRDLAYADTFIPIGHGQSMLPPKIDGRILNALAPKDTDVVLDVGTGSGFLAACLGRLSGRVRSMEVHPELAQRAAANLLAAAVNNVAVEVADATQLTDENMFDAIAVSGSLPVYDERYQKALRIGGRLFVVVGTGPVMEAFKITRVGEREWQREGLFETLIEPLQNSPRPPAFTF